MSERDYFIEKREKQRKFLEVLMAKKFAKYTLPKLEEALDTLANGVLAYVMPHVEGSSADWTDIPMGKWTAFKDAFAVWTPAYAACKGAHLPRDTQAKNLAKNALRMALTDLLERGLLLDPRTETDAVAMGFSLVDGTRTVVTVVNDAVDIDSISNGPIPGSHVHFIRYHIEGKAHRAKAPYHLAIFQVYLKGADDPDPILNSERGWSKDYVSMNEPFEIRHEQGDVGKIAYYRAHWETTGGAKGPWSMTSAEVP
jgi:hypothetical protein